MSWIPVVSSFLCLKLSIEHENCKDGIKIDRDSIVANIPAPSENDSYDILKARLNDAFGCRFIYAGKTDDWLFLEKLT